ncbi:c-type cytochrome [Laribacter hongkongensis]|uniref:c-type cytochrome n=1 Tax=Laribacter hongkongensis TaxID=168471 RepID=UPI001EFE9396|nr:c-type cytochrome [Laribacter hongkongensis]MCG9054169.1 c-type cytochrome [Laribacter hongkongensis]
MKSLPCGVIFLIANLCACSEQPTSSSPATQTEPTVIEKSGGSTGIGENIFKKTCAMCHQIGAAGAPVLGNKDDWTARIAQGKEILYQHALEGFNGNKGAMPAKGGNPSLSDEEVKTAVDFILRKSS